MQLTLSINDRSTNQLVFRRRRRFRSNCLHRNQEDIPPPPTLLINPYCQVQPLAFQNIVVYISDFSSLGGKKVEEMSYI